MILCSFGESKPYEDALTKGLPELASSLTLQNFRRPVRAVGA